MCLNSMKMSNQPVPEGGLKEQTGQNDGRKK